MIYLYLVLLSFIASLPCHCMAFYNGQDVTRTIARVDARLKCQEGVTKALGKTIIATARTDGQFYFYENWQIGWRVDIPYAWFYCPHNARQCNLPYCYKSQCLDDSLVQAFVATPDYGPWAFAVGIKLIFPTAGDNLEIGQGKYQALPSIAFRQYLTEWNEESYWGMIVRQDFDYAGYSNASRIRQTFIQPFINVGLPQNWFINSSPEMIYNWETSKWFIPFDLMVGKMITDKLIISLEYESGIVQDYQKYSQELEFRIGYFY